MRRRLAHLLVVVALCAAPRAHAADAPRVLVIAGAAERAIADKLSDELGTLGFEVEMMDAPAEAASRDELEGLSRARSAAAAVRVAPSPAGLEVWVVDRVTGKTVLREVAVGAGEPDREGLVALRAVELLRASLMEIDAPHPSRGEVPPRVVFRQVARLPDPRPAPSPPAPPPAADGPLLTFDLAPAIVGSPGGLDPFPAIDLGIHMPVTRRMGLELGATIPLTSVRDEGPEGSSSNRITMFDAGIRARFDPPGSRWIPQIGAGVTLLWLQTEGAASGQPYHGLSNDGWSAGVYLRPGVGFALSPRVYLRADVLAGAAFQRFVIDYAGRDAASWGLVYFAGTVGVEIGVP